MFGITLNLTIGENGIITKSIWANFTAEMTAIREKVDMEIAGKFIEGQKVDLFTEEVKVNDLSKSLKREMLYIMDGMRENKRPKDFDEDIINFLADDDGVLKGFHYIRADLSDGESKKYIYDENRDIIYKVKATNILGTSLHTYEYACMLKGLPYRKLSSISDYTISKEAKMIQKGNIAFYEPDLQNFSSGTVSVVYYNKDNLNETKEIPYYLSGLTDEVKIKNDTYVWYDYTSKKWANIKCESENELVSYWVWVPRYAYKIDGSNVDIKFIRDDNKYYDSESNSYKDLNSDYVVAAAFEQGGQHLKGIWMSKYEPSQTTVGYKPSTNKDAVNPPDLSNFNLEKTYYITYGENGTGEEQETLVQGNEPPADWYDYTAKKWANIKCVNTDTDGTELISYWVWIPRYASRVSQGQVEIIYVDADNKPLDKKYDGLFTIGTEESNDYVVQAAFEQGGQHLDGIWMSKYEPSKGTVGYKPSTNKDAVNPPDLSNFKSDETYYITYGNDGNGTEQETLVQGNNPPENWYDYTAKRWANIKTTANGITSYWVWVPRYASKVDQGEVEIIYIDENNNPLDSRYNGYNIGTSEDSEYKVQAAFEQGGQHLKGIWMSKYEPSMTTVGYTPSTNGLAVNAPDLSNFNPAKTYYITYGNDGNGTEQETLVQGNNPPSNWYDYANKKWANIKCKNTTDGQEIISYWTWVPRYAYKVSYGQVEIIYVDENNNPLDSKYNGYSIGTSDSSEYKVAAAFEQGGKHLKGIWMSKYEPSQLTIVDQP